MLCFLCVCVCVCVCVEGRVGGTGLFTFRPMVDSECSDRSRRCPPIHRRHVFALEEFYCTAVMTGDMAPYLIAPETGDMAPKRRAIWPLIWGYDVINVRGPYGPSLWGRTGRLFGAIWAVFWAIRYGSICPRQCGATWAVSGAIGPGL